MISVRSPFFLKLLVFESRAMERSEHFNDLSSLSCQMAGREGLAYSLAAGYTSVTMTCVSGVTNLTHKIPPLPSPRDIEFPTFQWYLPACMSRLKLKSCSAIAKATGQWTCQLSSPQLATPSSAVRVNLLLSYFASVFVVIFRLYRASTSSRLYIMERTCLFYRWERDRPSSQWFVKSRLSTLIVELSMGTSRRVSGRDGQAHPRARGGLPARHVYIQVELPPQVSDHRPDIIESRRDESGDTRPETSPAGNITLDKGGKLTRVASPSRRCLIDIPSLTSKFLATSSWRIFLLQ
ncbi:hypothetical protein J6590_098499 [Homalodisca vitripennis]|nr:hypothetical protein J6590_098499 [Homalodisca vitripennis]